MPEKPISFVHDTFSAEQKRAFAVRGWKRDRVETLPEGVSLVPHGRAASIYLRRGDRFMAFDAELEGGPDVDVALYTEPGLSNWIDVRSFATASASTEEKQEALQTVTAWLKARPMRFRVLPPVAETTQGTKESPER